jgi:hypothetical protein
MQGVHVCFSVSVLAPAVCVPARTHDFPLTRGDRSPSPVSVGASVPSAGPRRSYADAPLVEQSLKSSKTLLMPTDPTFGREDASHSTLLSADASLAAAAPDVAAAQDADETVDSVVPRFAALPTSQHRVASPLPQMSSRGGVADGRQPRSSGAAAAAAAATTAAAAAAAAVASPQGDPYESDEFIDD